MDSSLPVPRPNNSRGVGGGAPGATPCQLNPLHALAHLVNPRGATHDSPVLLPLLQVEASPTTGIHQLCPPLFQSQTQPARLPLPIPARTEAASGTEAGRGVKREYEPRVGNGKQSVANSDGWQWRKYGEKLVKGSPNPRSYYKCSHPGCLAKKIVERSEADGTVLSTEYKGDHCHPAPLTSKTSRFKPKPKAEPPATYPSTSLALQSVGMLPLSGGGMLPIPEALKSDFPVSNQGAGGAIDQEDETETSEPEPAAGLRTAPQDARPAQAAATAIRKLRENQDSPSKRLDLLAAYAEEAERQLQSHSNSPELGPSSKRQRTEGPAARGRGHADDDDDGSGAPCGSGMQRIVDINNMDDGYRWRKYGQKQVKGSPFPRAYYKCTHVGCSVRKHVERSAEDENRFVVTYEGQHNHRAPTGARRRSPKDVADAEEEELEGEDAEEDSSQPTSPNYAAHAAHHMQAQQQGMSRAQSRQLAQQQAQQQQQQQQLPQPVQQQQAQQQPGSAELGHQLQQLQNSILASTVLQQAALSGVLPVMPYNTLTNEALASLGLSAEALHGMEALNALNLTSVGNLADLTNLLRQHAQIDMALAAQAQAMDAAAAGWDPLACLITPRPNVSPGAAPAGQAQAVPSAGTGRQGKPAAAQARQQVATTEA